MSRAKIIKDEIVEENVKFLVIFIETKNSCIFMLSPVSYTHLTLPTTERV